jgi:thymidylate synthase (FAD)
MDPFFKIDVITKTPNPQYAIRSAMAQDYSANPIYPSVFAEADEKELGDYCVEKLLNNKRGHFGPLEHVGILFGVFFFPHSVMQQARTHRVGVSFDVQSFRYTGINIYDLGSRYYHETREKWFPNLKNVQEIGASAEKVFYLRQPGKYSDRGPNCYEYTKDQRTSDMRFLLESASRYYVRTKEGMPKEQARGMLPFDYRQHFYMSVNLRSAMHILDLRAKFDAQLEIRQMCELMVPHLSAWCPELMGWYKRDRLGKGLLAP